MPKGEIYQDWQLMSKENKLIPKLRFPEFAKNAMWEEFSLDNISPAIFDGTHQTPNYTEEGIPFFSVENLISRNKNKFISRDDYLLATVKNKPEKGDVLITRIGNIGFSTVVDWDYEFSIYVTLAVVKKSNKFIPQFLNGYFQSDFYQKEILSKSLLNAVPMKINMDELRKTKVLLPPDKEKNEQKKIASCLSSLNEVIAGQSQKLEALKNHKKGLMQNLFPQEGETVPKRRFKEFEKDGDWVVSKIGDFIESHKGGAPLSPSDFVNNSDFEVIPKKAINEGGLLNMSLTSPTFCTENFYNNNKKSVVDSSYLITTLRDLVPSGPSIGYIVKFNGIKKYILAQGVYGLKPKNTIVSDFLIQFSNTVRYRKLVNVAMVGSTQVHIRNSEFLDLPIQVPKKQEQQKIASCLTSLDALITAQMEKIEQLKLHKKGLMQGLFPKIND